MDKERIIQVIKYLAQNHVGSKCWTCVSNQISLLILTPFCYNRYSEKARGGIKETKDSEQGFILSRTRRGADKRRNSGSLVLCVCTRAHHTFHSPVLTGPSSRELFCQLFYNGPKVYRAGGDLTSLPLGQPEELDAQSTRPVPLSQAPPLLQPRGGSSSGHFLKLTCSWRRPGVYVLVRMSPLLAWLCLLSLIVSTFQNDLMLEASG